MNKFFAVALLVSGAMTFAVSGPARAQNEEPAPAAPVAAHRAYWCTAACPRRTAPLRLSQVATLLVAKGADLHARDTKGREPLDFASKSIKAAALHADRSMRNYIESLIGLDEYYAIEEKTLGLGKDTRK